MLVKVNELLKLTSLTHQKMNSEMHFKVREILEWQTKNSETNEK